DGGTEPGVHDEREALPAAYLADLLDGDGTPVDVQYPVALQPADRRPGDAVPGQQIRQHPAAVRLDQPVPERVDRMHQPRRFQRGGTDGGDLAVRVDRPLVQLRRLVERARVAQPVEVPATGGRVVGVHRMRYPVQGQPLHHPGYPQAVVAVEVAQADPGHVGGADTAL